MPELPEVETVRSTLERMVVGKEIRDIDVFYDKMVRTKTPSIKTLIGRQIKGISRIGKHLIFHFDDLSLISHLRMEGKYFIKPLLEDRNKHEHLIFYFTDDTTMRYHDTRKFGTFDLVKTDTMMDLEPLCKVGPEPWDSSMTVDYLYKRLKSKTIAIKSALLDQTIIAGLGNIYVNEVCFRVKVHPSMPSNKVTKKLTQEIINESIYVLEKAIALGGTTIRSYTSSLGVTGRFQNDLMVHERQGEPCKVCGDVIDKIKVNGRGSYYCPSCQSKK
jgi:formamidopyrimidine-DNA glycosylase